MQRSLIHTHACNVHDDEIRCKTPSPNLNFTKFFFFMFAWGQSTKFKYVENIQNLPPNDVYLLFSFEFVHRRSRWSAERDAAVPTRSCWQLWRVHGRKMIGRHCHVTSCDLLQLSCTHGQFCVILFLFVSTILSDLSLTCS